MDVHKGHNNELDKAIRSKLNGLTPEVQRGSWEQLSQRLDAAEQATLFDEQMGGRMEEMKVPYQRSSWAVLAARLELERRRMRAIVHYKAMETSLLLLLFITAWQLLPIPVIAPAELLPVLDPNMPIAAVVVYEHSTTSSDRYAEQTTGLITNQDRTTSLAEEQTIANGATDNSQVSVPKTSTQANDLKPMAQRPILTVPSLLPASTLATLDYEKNAQQQLRELQAEKTANLTSPSDAFERHGALAALEGTGLNLLDYGSPEELLDFVRPNERKTFVRIGFVGSPDYNRVVTPKQQIDNGEIFSSDRYSLGYSGGLTIGIEHGKWEIETGAVYAARRYQAIPTVYVSGNLRDGYTARSLRDFELNTVNLPLNFRYNFDLHEKWRLYVQAGASLNIILGANYYTVDESAFAGLSDTNPNPTGTSSANKPEPLRNKNLTAGWIEGGSLLENATLYSDFGLGLERYLTPSLSTFVQPTYHHSLQLFNEGLGPYQDRIHNFGIGIGLKVRL